MLASEITVPLIPPVSFSKSSWATRLRDKRGFRGALIDRYIWGNMSVCVCDVFGAGVSKRWINLNWYQRKVNYSSQFSGYCVR